MWNMRLLYWVVDKRGGQTGRGEALLLPPGPSRASHSLTPLWLKHWWEYSISNIGLYIGSMAAWGCQDSTARPSVSGWACPFHELSLTRQAGECGSPAVSLVVDPELICSPASPNTCPPHTDTNRLDLQPILNSEERIHWALFVPATKGEA